MSSATPEFIFVRPGDYVVIKKENHENTNEKSKNYWVGQVIDCIGGARNPNSWTLFQVANIDNGEITICLLYTSPSPRDTSSSRMPSSA